MGKKNKEEYKDIPKKYECEEVKMSPMPLYRSGPSWMEFILILSIFGLVFIAIPYLLCGKYTDMRYHIINNTMKYHIGDRVHIGSLNIDGCVSAISPKGYIVRWYGPNSACEAWALRGSMDKVEFDFFESELEPVKLEEKGK